MTKDESNDNSVTPLPPASELSPKKVLCVKNVPPEVWRRARRNALDSGVAFRDYVISLLANCQPTSTVGTAPESNTP